MLLKDGAAYRLDDGTGDVYFDISATPRFGYESNLTREQMLEIFAERGGDPDRAGKRDPLDPLLWRGAREGEPSWPGGELGPGRPGWHIECAVIALNLLGDRIDVQGGGNDLIFPHHECSAAHAERLTGEAPFAEHYVHAGMIGLDGEKMSKSRGNLVFVSRLRADKVDPMAVRLALISGHYRSDRPGPTSCSPPRTSAWTAGGGPPPRPPGRPGPSCWPRYAHAWPTTSTRPGPWRQPTAGPRRPWPAPRTTRRPRPCSPTRSTPSWASASSPFRLARSPVRCHRRALCTFAALLPAPVPEPPSGRQWAAWTAGSLRPAGGVSRAWTSIGPVRAGTARRARRWAGGGVSPGPGRGRGPGRGSGRGSCTPR